MSLVGFDDIAECVQATPALTTIRYPLEGIGQMAARCLIDDIEGEGVSRYKILLHTELVVRGASSGLAQATPEPLAVAATT